MPYFKYTINLGEENLIGYFWEVLNGEEDAATAISISGDKGETTTSSSSSYKTKYVKLPHYLKSCLDYCALLSCIYRPTPGYRLMMEKERVVRLVIAQVLTEEKTAGDASSLEDIASSFLDQLLGFGMLIQKFDYWSGRLINSLDISEPYYRLCIIESKKEDFVARSVDLPIHVFIRLHDAIEISPYMENFPIQSLFFYSMNKKLPPTTLNTICGSQSLSLLDFKSWASDISFNEVGELVNLRFLSLCFPFSSEIPRNLFNLQHLQTLELYSRSNRIPEEVVHIKTLKHLENLVCWDARTGINGELNSLRLLRRLHVFCVAYENIDKLLESIMTMKNLISLFMEAESIHLKGKHIRIFPFLEPFSPPPLLQELQLSGILMELPSWFASMNNLTILVLEDSSLSENPCSILQFLPKLKRLHLYNAYDAKLIGKDFCSGGGFPKLEILEITSDILVEWTEIVVGSFPCLTSFVCCCPNLMFFPEGLQYIFTLQKLHVTAHGDLIRRLYGDESYKIKHIPSVKCNF